MLLPGKLVRFAAAFISMAGVSVIAGCAGDATAPASTAAGAAASFAGGATGPDLQISGSASTGSPNAGATFSYTYQIRNSGSTMATSVSFVDTLPAGTGFLGAGASGYPSACTVANMIVTCDLQAIAKGSQISVMLTLNAPTAAGSFANTAHLNEGEIDVQPSNNSVTVTVQVKTALAACPVPADQTTTDGMVMYGVMDQFSAYEQFEYQVNGVNYWVVTNYFDGTQPLTSVINLDCKTSPAQFVQVGNFVNVTGVVDGTVLLPGQTTAIPVLHASVIQVLTHKDKA